MEITIKSEEDIFKYNFKEITNKEEINLCIIDVFIEAYPKHEFFKYINESRLTKLEIIPTIKFRPFSKFDTLTEIISNPYIHSLKIPNYFDKKKLGETLKKAAQNLRVLEFKSQGVSFLDVLELPKFINLKKFRLNDIENIGDEFNTLISTSHLETLEFFRCSFNEKFRFQVDLKNLKVLVFSVCKCIHFESLLKCNTSLEYLNVINPKIHKDNSYSLLKYIEQNHSLETIFLSRLEYWNLNTKAICQSMKHHSKLKTLILFLVNSHDLNELEGFLKDNKSITSLHLNDDYEKGFDFDINGFLSLKSLILNSPRSFNNLPILSPQIESLSLFKFKVNEEDFRLFMNTLKNNHTLKYLLLYPLNNVIYIIYNYLSSNPRLESLSLSLDQCGNDIIPILQALQGNNNLKSLNLTFDIHPDFMFMYKNDVYIEIEDLFAYNFSLCELKINNSTFDIPFEKYLKRNEEYVKIRKMNVIETKKDIYFLFE